MEQVRINKKVLGATLVGGALVCGAFALNNLKSNQVALTATVAPVQQIDTTLGDRTFIAVNDTNNDGVEDWREEFVVQAPIQLTATGTPTAFTMPTTVTDQVGIQVFESLLKNKANVQFQQTNTQIVDRTTDKISSLAKDTLYTKESITTVPTEPVAIRRYANMMGQSIITNNVTGSEGELEIVYAALQTNRPEDLKKLEALALMYQKLRDDALAAPVPERFAEDHLNLINAYHAMYRNISDFGLIFDDPLVALLRIKRYQDDATALALILNAMYRNAAPFQSLFTEDDPAVVFTAFSNH